jgi:hypothetical protein
MESTASHRKVKVFRGRQQIERLLAEQAQSGQSARAFCADKNIAVGTFYHWKEKYGKSRVSIKPGFTPIEIVPSAGNGLFAQVGSIKIYQPVSAAYLKELLA